MLKQIYYDIKELKSLQEEKNSTREKNHEKGVWERENSPWLVLSFQIQKRVDCEGQCVATHKNGNKNSPWEKRFLCLDLFLLYLALRPENPKWFLMMMMNENTTFSPSFLSFSCFFLSPASHTLVKEKAKKKRITWHR